MVVWHPPPTPSCVVFVARSDGPSYNCAHFCYNRQVQSHGKGRHGRQRGVMQPSTGSCDRGHKNWNRSPVELQPRSGGAARRPPTTGMLQPLSDELDPRCGRAARSDLSNSGCRNRAPAERDRCWNHPFHMLEPVFGYAGTGMATRRRLLPGDATVTTGDAATSGRRRWNQSSHMLVPVWGMLVPAGRAGMLLPGAATVTINSAGTVHQGC